MCTWCAAAAAAVAASRRTDRRQDFQAVRRGRQPGWAGGPQVLELCSGGELFEHIVGRSRYRWEPAARTPHGAPVAVAPACSAMLSLCACL